MVEFNASLGTSPLVCPSSACAHDWLSVLLFIVSVDTSICEADYLFSSEFPGLDDELEKDVTTVKAGYVLILAGAFLSFVVFPVGRLDRSAAAAVGALLCLAVCVGNALFWVGDKGRGVGATCARAACEVSRHTHAQRLAHARRRRVGQPLCSAASGINVLRTDGSQTYALAYPLHSKESSAFPGPSGFPDSSLCFARAVWVAAVYAASLIGSYADGRTLGCILAAVTVSDYQPGGLEALGSSMKLRCSEDWKTCTAGVFLKPPEAGRVTGEKKGWLIAALFVMAGVGGALIWAPTQGGRHLSHAQEASLRSE
eukprot:gene2768-19889_t